MSLEKKIKLEGEIVVLRKLEYSDAEFIYKHINHKDIVRYTMNIPWPYTPEHAVQFIKKSKQGYKKGKELNLGITLKEDNQVIGIMSFNKIDLKNKNAEVGYWLGKKYWRKGIAKEALILILDYAFKELKLERISSRTFHSNKASYGLLLRMGFKQEGIARKDIFQNNKWYDHLMFGLLKEELK
ncbi:GNAT family N-acetyltransferase [Candidatus Woesearchaeota archaeon]|nr:GNAT family N-acetyltransferase [Candidatus Woesearchaeota archaeon]